MMAFNKAIELDPNLLGPGTTKVGFLAKRASMKKPFNAYDKSINASSKVLKMNSNNVEARTSFARLGATKARLSLANTSMLKP